ncbi:hypothetical protein [Nannocystis pusilla]|uniref:hypothetical protein n=1 Tax=Nannocystis pusilla TaxID=889268 RepID=UPI003DA685FA
MVEVLSVVGSTVVVDVGGVSVVGPAVVGSTEVAVEVPSVPVPVVVEVSVVPTVLSVVGPADVVASVPEALPSSPHASSVTQGRRVRRAKFCQDMAGSLTHAYARLRAGLT